MTDNVDSFLIHYGVKGMQWGVRKEPDSVVATRTLRNGNVLQMTKNPAPPIGRTLSVIPAYKKAMDNTINLTLRNKEGKRIGDATLFKESDGSMNMAWIGVKSSERGKGYASAAVGAVIDFAKSQNIKKMTLEVPGNSPDAKHIYEKFGFSEKKSLTSVDDVWGGLTAMELTIK